MDIGLVALGIGVMGIALYLKSVPVMFASIMCWIGFAAYMQEAWSAAYAIDNTTPVWTSDRMFMWVGIALALMNVYFILRFNHMIGHVDEPDITPEQEFADEYQKIVDQRDMFRRLHGPRSR